MSAFIRRFAQNRSGATAIEFGLIAGLISVVSSAAVTTIGICLSPRF